jgi:hypothetical protein
VTVPDAKNFRGSLPMHIEVTDHPYRGVHNISTPLMPVNVVSNDRVTGIQFIVARIDGLDPEYQRHLADVYIQRLAARAFDEAPPICNDCFVYRPRLKTGDVAFFKGIVPHSTFIPQGARDPRASFDVRIFPDTPENRLVAQQLAQKPLPLPL